jgi:hypothetical protein
MYRCVDRPLSPNTSDQALQFSPSFSWFYFPLFCFKFVPPIFIILFIPCEYLSPRAFKLPLLIPLILGANPACQRRRKPRAQGSTQVVLVEGGAQVVFSEGSTEVVLAQGAQVVLNQVPGHMVSFPSSRWQWTRFRGCDLQLAAGGVDENLDPRGLGGWVVGLIAAADHSLLWILVSHDQHEL